LVPHCTILEEKEVEELKKKFNIQKLSQLPEISRFDPQALAICLRPGQVCHFQRESATAMLYEYYRVCV
jgi:DNA-directed RNA polymerase subunit H (RpoH/RPB5)